MVALFVKVFYHKGNETLRKVIRIFNLSVSNTEVGYQVRKRHDPSSCPLIFGQQITMIMYNLVSRRTLVSNRIFIVSINQ